MSHQPAMVELNRCGVLQHVDGFGRERGDVIWDPLTGHLGEGIVDQTCIQPCHKRSCENSRYMYCWM